MSIDLKDPVDQRLFYLTKNFDIQDWREVRDDYYWWVTHPVTGEKTARSKISKLQLIEYYVKHGVRKPL